MRRNVVENNACGKHIQKRISIEGGPSVQGTHDLKNTFALAISYCKSMCMGRRSKPNYAQGTVFLVPLRGGGYARGVAARLDGSGGVFGYFFGPRLNSPGEGTTRGLDPHQAVALGQFGDLHLINNEWPQLGKIENWSANEWPMPPLIRVDEFDWKATLTHFDDRTFERIDRKAVSPTLLDQYPEDGSHGAGSVEIWLTKLLEPRDGRYANGTCFLVLLRGGGYARGVVARMNGKGRVFGYFFGPEFSSPEEATFHDLDPRRAMLVSKFDDLLLMNGEWIQRGQLENWNPDKWPMPPLIRLDVEGNAFLSHYDDRTFECIREEKVSPSLMDTHTHDGTMDARAVQVRLSLHLHKTSNGYPSNHPSNLSHTKTVIAKSADVADPTQPCPVHHYLYFPKKKDAQRIASELRQRGFITEERRGADGKDWLVLASHTIVPTEDLMDETEETLAALVEPCGGEYDGYELEVG